MGKILLAVLILFLLEGCINQPDVEFSNWPHGYSSAVAITFETEQASVGQLEALGEALKRVGIKATFFVVPGYFEGNPRALDPIRDFEVASMGWYQANWKDASLTKDFQKGEIRKAHEWLTKEGFEVRGFRSPFIKSNKETYEVLQEMHYIYDSSEYYGFMPYWIDGIVEIPLSVNYDLYWDERSIGYSTMPTYLAFQKSYDESGLFTFYGHADRTYEHIENFTALVEYMGKRNVWFASMSEVADWWNTRHRLELKKESSAVTVKNKGSSRASGVTLKIGDGVVPEGATSVKRIDGYVYAVLPDIGPDSEITIKLNRR